MDGFMAINGVFILVFIVLIRIIFNQDKRITALVKENTELKKELKLQELPVTDKDIIFDAQGGYKVVSKHALQKYRT